MRLVRLTSVDQLKTGLRVRCTLSGARIPDAKWYVEKDLAFLCQNVCDGVRCKDEDRQGYRYSYAFDVAVLRWYGLCSMGLGGLRAVLKEGETL